MIARIKILLAAIMVFSLVIIGCESHDKSKSAGLQRIGDVKLFTFTSDSEHFLTNAQPFVVSADTSLKSTLVKLGEHLAKTFFSKTYSNEETNIRFEIVNILEIPAGSRGVRVAVINMIDKEKFAMNYFFQGSTGAQITFHMLSATFIQPQLIVSLLDGLIILYNGKLLPEMDHINLSGILTPMNIKHVAIRAIYNTRTEEANFDMEASLYG